jgi:polysaccharide biosynthesis/export protein
MAVSALFFSSCAPIRTSTYFRSISRDTVITMAKAAQEELKIQHGDVLTLVISSLNKEEDNIYNASSPNGYEVDNNGEIYIHHLGKVKAAGLTRKEFKSKLEKDLVPYLKDPLASVSFSNHFVTIMGSVGTPQRIPMPAEKLSILDVLANSGASVPLTELSKILVIRDSSIDKKQLKYVNMEDHSVFASDFYYLKPNDVVVVKPDEASIQKEQKRVYYQQASGIVLQFITIALIVYNTFFRK